MERGSFFGGVEGERLLNHTGRTHRCSSTRMDPTMHSLSQQWCRQEATAATSPTNSTRLNGAETAVWNKNQTVSGDSVYLQKLVTA